jgi:hypothetical protein
VGGVKVIKILSGSTPSFSSLSNLAVSLLFVSFSGFQTTITPISSTSFSIEVEGEDSEPVLSDLEASVGLVLSDAFSVSRSGSTITITEAA